VRWVFLPGIKIVLIDCVSESYKNLYTKDQKTKKERARGCFVGGMGDRFDSAQMTPKCQPETYLEPRLQMR